MRGQNDTSTAEAAANQMWHFEDDLGVKKNEVVQGRCNFINFHLILLPTLVELMEGWRVDNCSVQHS